MDDRSNAYQAIAFVAIIDAMIITILLIMVYAGPADEADNGGHEHRPGGRGVTLYSGGIIR